MPLKSKSTIIFDIFFSKYIFKFRHVLSFLIIIIISLNVWNISNLQLTEDIDRILKDSNPVQKAYNWGIEELWRRSYIDIEINWGVEPKLWLDPSTATWDNKGKGILILDEDFDLSPEEN